MSFSYYGADGVSAVSKSSGDTKVTFPNSVPIDYEVYKELRDKPQTFKDKFAVVEKTVKGEKIKVVEAKKEAKDVQQDSKQPKEDNPI